MTAQAAWGAVALSALLALGGLAPALVLAAKPRNGRIAFVSWRAGRIAYYAMDGDGKRVDRLSSVPIWSGAPAAWSPDGGRLAYTYEVEAGGYALAVLDLGSRATRTVSPPGAYSFESWSPDGRRLACANVVTIAHGPGGKAWNDGPSHIYVAGADGAGWSAVAEGPAWDRSPTWAPDGKSIAFISNRDGSDELYVLRLEGGSPRRLTFEGTRVEVPRWSPDGLRIAVLAQRGARRVLLPVAGGAAQPLGRRPGPPTAGRSRAWARRPATSSRSGSGAATARTGGE